jgi:hypothetical protein
MDKFPNIWQCTSDIKEYVLDGSMYIQQNNRETFVLKSGLVVSLLAGDKQVTWGFYGD